MVPGRGGDRCRHRRADRVGARGDRGPPGLGQGLQQRVVLDVPRRAHHDVAGVVRAAVQLAKIGHLERGHGVARAEDRVAVGMVPPQPLVVELEHEVIGRVLDHADLLEHDLPLEREIRRTKARPEDEIADDIGRLREMFVEHAGLVARVLA
jgi:hypothetical protein